jgi:hypothetical protein
MPFKSRAQMYACFAQRARDRKAGIEPRWDCDEWLRETKKQMARTGQKTLPMYKNGKSARKSSRKRSRRSKSKKQTGGKRRLMRKRSHKKMRLR